jgi:hypothetical protein
MILEFQRYGRNKETTVDSSYISGGEYRRKFDSIIDNAAVSRILYSKAKEMLLHRSGTLFEDTYWFDGASGAVLASVLDETAEEQIGYTTAVARAIEGVVNLIAMHTHPNSMPPSIADFNSAFRHKYAVSIVICHDGSVYIYASAQEVPEYLYKLYVENFLRIGYTDKEAQLAALDKIKQSYDIDYCEVR